MQYHSLTLTGVDAHHTACAMDGAKGVMPGVTPHMHWPLASLLCPAITHTWIPSHHAPDLPLHSLTRLALQGNLTAASFIYTHSIVTFHCPPHLSRLFWTLPVYTNSITRSILYCRDNRGAPFKNTHATLKIGRNLLGRLLKHP